MIKASRRMLGLLAATCALALAPLTPSAAAPNALDVSVFCENLGMRNNQGSFSCDAFASGGTGDYSYSWSAVQNATILENWGSYIYGSCAINQSARVNVVVTDSSGVSVSKIGRVLCRKVAS